MRNDIRSPSSFTDKVEVADWMELQAIFNSDHNISGGDLQRILSIENVFGGSPDASSQIEQVCIEVFLELEYRKAVVGENYPFFISGTVLECEPDYKENYAAYIFCLCMSYLGWVPEKGTIANPRLRFERASALASAAFLNCDYFVFGTSSTTVSTKGVGRFSANVNSMCKLIGEGIGIKPIPKLNKQDDHMDIVLVKKVDMHRQSNIVFFGQCATGADWEGKLSEVMPDAFWAYWVQNSAVSHLLRSFFVPHRIKDERWAYVSTRGGLMFDRLRIARWMPRHAEFSSFAPYLCDDIREMLDKHVTTLNIPGTKNYIK